LQEKQAKYSVGYYCFSADFIGFWLWNDNPILLAKTPAYN